MAAKAHNRETPKAKRARNARRLLAEHTNSWDGSEPLKTLVECQWAVVIERDGDSWVVGANNLLDIANIELSCLTGTEGDDEWVEGVYDLETGEPVRYTKKTIVEVHAEPYDGVTHRAQTA